MFLALFNILVILWLGGFLAFHVAGALIHLLLLVALIALSSTNSKRSGRQTFTSTSST